VRERNTRLAGCVDCLNIVRNLLRQALHYITPTSINIYHEKEKKKKFVAGDVGIYFPGKEKKRIEERKSYTVTLLIYLFFRGLYVCMYKPITAGAV
jgi:hypothetical protein